MPTQFKPKFDIIAFSETWFSSNNNLNIFSLPGYQFCHMDHEDRRGGGVAIYVKNGIEFDVIESIGFAVDNLLECISRKKSIIVTCIYRQPDIKIEAYVDIIESFLNDMKSYIYLCGDFNINFLNCYYHHDTKYFVDSLFILDPCINQPTRITTATATLIDNILLSISGISRCSIIINNATDHLPIFLLSSKNANKKENYNYLCLGKQYELSMKKIIYKLNQ